MSRIKVGIGGWTYPPWRGLFYPSDLPQSRELAYAAGELTAIEINGTYYRLQSPQSFTRWAAETPEGFVFSVKAHRATASRTRLAESGESVARFLASGLAGLGAKLGPVLWQLPPTKPFDPTDLAAFLKLLPDRVANVRLRHVLEVRHASFGDPRFVALLRERGVALCFSDGAGHPGWSDATADFVYLRLRRTQADRRLGYAPAALDRWAERLRLWENGSEPDDLPRILGEPQTWPGGRDVFAFFIDGAKERAPAAALALLERLQKPAGEQGSPPTSPNTARQKREPRK
jgi:uncharacterized protein YecE (DUF72 family)